MLRQEPEEGDLGHSYDGKGEETKASTQTNKEGFAADKKSMYSKQSESKKYTRQSSQKG